MSQAPAGTISAPPPRWRRRLLWNGAGLLIALTAVLGAVGFWLNSSSFENMIRNRIVAQLEKATGGRVEVASFHWHLLDLEAEAGGLVIHGLEDPGEVPYAQVQNARVRISILGVLSPRILLRDLDVLRPRFHLIVYPNGSTNQPHPRNPKKLRRPAIDTLFDLKTGHLSVEQGGIDFDSRASGLDFYDRYLPIDFQANDASVVMQYVPPAGANPERYHVEAGVRDLALLRGGTSPSASDLHGYLQASIDFTRHAALLRSLRITAHARGQADHILEVSGAVSDFSHPHWEGKVTGEFDMRLLDPILGYTATPSGVARMNLAAAGDMGEFRIDGPVHVDDGAYVSRRITARRLQVDTQVHADPNLMHFGSVIVRFAGGGQLDGDLVLEHWAPHLPGRPALSAQEPAPAAPRSKHFWNRRQPAPAPPPPSTSRNTLVKDPDTEITVNGKVTSRFENVALDTILDIVSKPPYNRLGIGTLLNGPATAEWVHGDIDTLKVGASLDLRPSSPPRESAAGGVLDGTYTQHDGAVDLRQLDLVLPASEIQARGRVGVDPLSSPTSLDIDFRSRNLGEFDTVLRALSLERNGRSGTAALPISLGGQGEFHGTWAGSLESPRLAGEMQATQVALELPPGAAETHGAPRFLHWDSVEAHGSYDAEHIAVVHSRFARGQELVTLEGTLSAPGAAPPGAMHGDEMPAFHADSLLRARVNAKNVAVNDVTPFLGIQPQVTGTLDGDIEASGPVRALGGAGWVELDGATVYGEPVSRVRAQGTVANQVIRLSSIAINHRAGNISGSGSWDLRSRRFQAEARGSGIDIAKIEHFHTRGETVSGKLGFTATASGTPDEPRLDGRGTVVGVKIDGESLGTVDLVAHTLNRDLVYDVTSRTEAAELKLHGQTGMRGDFQTQARLDFSRFDIGAIFQLAHVRAVKGESSLSGTASLYGPLAHPEQLRGEARLQSMALTVSGVHLASQGGMHATLVDARVNLDPLHITGDQTDMRLQGSLGLRDTRQLDFAASGSINLKLAETLDSDLTAGGTTTFQVEAHGPLANPGLRGRVDFNNGSLALEDLPNGLSQLHGTLEFNQNRLEVRSLTAMTGGGQLSLGGYLAYQHGLFADLTVTGKSVRIRYPQGISSLADATLHLQGTQSSLLLSGNVMLTRFSVNPDFDMAALTTRTSTVQAVVPPDAPSNHVRLDVRIQSAPQLNFQNAYAKLAGDVDLRLRGTLAAPSLLGRVSVTEGNATIAGTRYELQRGDVLFTNPVRIQPTIDLNATARVQDYDITLGLHGTPDKLSVTYRSEPPLPEADVVALLALGRTQSEQGLYTQQQQQSAGIAPSTDVLLGGALNATVSSRVQKLFGAGSVKVDPSYLGALGNSTTRITVDEQLGKNVTLTYATNVDTTAQQLLQAEIAINRHVSLLVTRDESDVFSIVLKATRRYR